MLTSVVGPNLPVKTCARRLAALGVGPAADQQSVLAWADAPAGTDGAEVACEISWWGPGRPAGERGSEALVQAATGLMYLHGRDLGGPRRLGLEIASVAAGMMAAQALTAAAIGYCRGVPIRDIQTSVLQAGLWQASHYLAAETCPPEEVPAAAPAPGPPFCTSDGRWFEIETFDSEAWKAFWLRLGAPAADLGQAWTRFRPRYYRGTTSLPHGFHEATAARTLDEVSAAARFCGVSLSSVRRYEEVLADAFRSDGRPIVASRGPRGQELVSAPRWPRGESFLPLAGIEVVEATSRLQGPLAGLFLQMLGATVTRVESPGGDVGRSVPPLAGDTGSFFLCFNRGKATVELDLATAAGRQGLAERVGRADVFLHNWRPGKAAEWGLDAADLARLNPRLVYTEASGWAPGSGAADLIGTDFLVQAWTGLANGLHPEPDPPKPSRVLLTDFMGALVTCEGILAGLYRREQQRGVGGRVSTSLEAGGMALQAHVLDGRSADRRHGRPRWTALDVPIGTSDGWLVVDVADDDDLRRLAQACDIDPTDDRQAGESGVARALSGGSTHHWEERLRAAGLGCSRVATDMAAIADDPRLVSLFEPLGASCRAPASPWRLS